MRIFKIFLIVSVFTLFTAPLFASELFYKVNSDLRRVGLDEILKMGEVGFETGSYRLDPDFRLGYGDTVTVSFWGKLQAAHKLTIDRDGNIVIPLIGKVSILGRTLDEARSTIKRELDKKYSNVEFDLNLTDVQDIRIMVLGNAKNPGPYAVSPFCRVIDVIVKSGGPNDNGSLSDIRLIRDGKQIISFNTYDFIFKGDESKNIRLKHGDKVYIPKINNLVAIRGDVRYPGIYEAKDNTTLSTALDLAGGILSTRFKRKTLVLRINPESKVTEVIKEVIFDSSKGIDPKDDIILEYGDAIIVTTAFDSSPYPEDLFRAVHISGEVEIPGEYLIREGEKLSSLIKRVSGLKSTGFARGAIFTRSSVKQKQKSILDKLVRAQERAILEEGARLAEAILTQEEKEMRQRALEYRRKALDLMASRVPEGRIIIDLEEVMNGDVDIVLEKGDSIYVPPMPDWVLVTGAVYNPQSVAFEEGKPLEHYLNAVGGPNKFADKDDVYIIKANGRVKSKGTGYGRIEHGDTIVVPEKIE